MRKLMGIPLAAALLVLGATAVLAQSGAGSAIVAAAASTPAGSLLTEVLSGLVKDGTISQDQADKIVDAVDNRVQELRTERQKLREQMRQFLQDGELSADELAQLPADNPLRHLDQYLQDGKLTRDELRQLRGLGRGFGLGHGRGLGGGPMGGPWDLGQHGQPDGSAAPDASAAPGS